MPDWSRDDTWKKKASENRKKYKKALEKADERALIRQLPVLHEAVFSRINCLDCANCCKNHSPTFKTTDIKRISRHLRMKESSFIDCYLKIDEDNDYVLKSSPCAFLADDNTCNIYEVRPGDCARYPYTDEDVFVKRRALTLANAVVCPAVHSILEHISKS